MAAATSGHRKIISIYDYPEHLNPFREEETNSKMRFWTLGRKLKRSNSITFSGIKDLRNSWTLKSFMKKGKKEQSSIQDKPSTTVNGESSPVQFRRSLQHTLPTAAAGVGERNTFGSPERYVYGGSVTPLPRSRFQERLRSPSQYEVNSLRVGVFDRASASPRLDTASLASDVTGSRLSVESVNPFEEGPVPPVRASRRKKKRAPPPPPPPSADTSINTTLNSSTSEKDNSHIEIEKNKTSTDPEIDTEDSSLHIELKIVEDEDHKGDQEEKSLDTTVDKEIKSEETSKVIIENNKSIETPTKDEKLESIAEVDKNQNQINGDENVISFAKVDIKTYRRNSSFNEDDVRLRRGNLEDFNITANKRSKSLSNTNDNIYTAYDINLNATEEEETDANSNEPKRVVCKLFSEAPRKHSVDNSLSSTEREFIEIDKATRELEREINKLNSALNEDEPVPHDARLSVSEIKRKFDNADRSSPNPIPKPRRSNFASPINGNVNT